MGKNVFDALPSLPTGVRYSAAAVAEIVSGSLETLFLQRWTHKLVNVIDKNILQKVGCLQFMTDPVGVMSDEFMDYKNASAGCTANVCIGCQPRVKAKTIYYSVDISCLICCGALSRTKKNVEVEDFENGWVSANLNPDFS